MAKFFSGRVPSIILPQVQEKVQMFSFRQDVINNKVVETLNKVPSVINDIEKVTETLKKVSETKVSLRPTESRIKTEAFLGVENIYKEYIKNNLFPIVIIGIFLLYLLVKYLSKQLEKEKEENLKMYPEYKKEKRKKKKEQKQKSEDIDLKSFDDMEITE